MSDTLSSWTPQEIITVVAVTIGMLSSMLTVVLLFQMTSTLNFFKNMFEKIYNSSSKIQNTTDYMQRRWDGLITSSSDSVEYIKTKWDSISDMSSLRNKTSSAISSIGEKINNLSSVKKEDEEEESKDTDKIGSIRDLVRNVMNNKG
jgi:predicted PurR-regulated permease PerM